MNLGLGDQVAMVGGASQGLGFGIAQALAEEGAKVSIASRSEEAINLAAAKLHKETGASVLPGVFDASDKDSIMNWTDKTCQHFGGVDCLVVNAGGPPAGKFDDFDDQDWQAAFELNLLSAIRLIRCVLPSMRSRGRGSILCLTSSSVKEPIDILLLSNVMRSGVTSLVKSLANQLAKEHIRINNLIPGRIDTDRVRSLDRIHAQSQGISIAAQQAKSKANIPMARYGTIEEFGKAGAFLLSEAASYITGMSMAVDGGLIKTVW